MITDTEVRSRPTRLTALAGLAGLAGLLLVACGQGSATPATTSGTDSSGSTATTDQAGATSSSQAESTLPAGPPVYDQRTLGDNFELESFVLTVTVATTTGELSENTTTTAFIRDPLSISEQTAYSSSGAQDSDRRYLVGGRSYEETNTGDWYLYESGNPAASQVGSDADLRSGNLSGVLTADLAGEVTEVLSQVGQLTEITLPADMAPMTQALDIGVALSRLLPPGSELWDMIRYRHGIGVDYYSFKTPIRSNDELLDFYRTMPATDGWTVTHIGHVEPHLEQINCETRVECVILNNGADQIVVSFAGGITLEFDRERVFSAL